MSAQLLQIVSLIINLQKKTDEISYGLITLLSDFEKRAYKKLHVDTNINNINIQIEIEMLFELVGSNLQTANIGDKLV